MLEGSFYKCIYVHVHNFSCMYICIFKYIHIYTYEYIHTHIGDRDLNLHEGIMLSDEAEYYTVIRASQKIR
jgi:hypothetical protein